MGKFASCGALVAVSAALGLASGCMGAHADSEDVGSATEELGESTCATTAADASGLAAAPNVCSGGYSASADGNYTHSDCVNGYVAEYSSGISGSFLRANALYTGVLPTTSAVCVDTFVHFYAYYYNGSTWTESAISKKQGVWNGSSCSIEFESGYAEISLPASGITKVRVVARAWFQSFVAYDHTVETRLYHANAC